ncbi:ABC transporter substrate-binding protein [Pseudomonas berkeleyensis]|uniref:ABC transporter substrate-binding protein n=1 Tax=Pseudomonas berkeleyensis TaxID=2726956 RepID=A0A7G5DNQ9_9PSED|nr:ABC transporter substrate-binding protein [Pseudomonas berkeleyensis]QMV63384.1 ABC transporter substrate-binding protein [Pseudomonas berkeleyensis]WSO38847.1 ABC transporter substrate-binding protein [Pseudomonas berkeleyensis]
MSLCHSRLKPLLPTLVLSSLLLASPASPAWAATVTSCDRQVTIEQPPQRAVSHDVNMTAMLLALGLRERMAGYTGISGWKTLDPDMRAQLDGLPELAARYPSLENLLDAGTDFVFAGWNYGMRIGGEITPASLARFDIPVYELSESCAHVMPGRVASLDDVYNDLRNLGRIFAVVDRAEALVQGMQVRVAAVQARLGVQPTRPRVFVYDSGEDVPFSAGRLGMPQPLIEAAGGRNVMDSVAANWMKVGWESVVEEDPELILIVDYGERTAAQKRDFLLQHPALQGVTAIREQRFVVLSYLAVTPSLDNAAAIETLAAALHPEVFAQ